MPRSAVARASPRIHATVDVVGRGLRIEVTGDTPIVRWLVKLAIDRASERGLPRPPDEPTLVLDVDRWTCTAHLEGVDPEATFAAIDVLRREGCAIELL